MREVRYGKLRVGVGATADEVARAAADVFAAAVGAALADRDEAAVVLTLGGVQGPFCAALKRRSDIQWGRVNVLHTDTFAGLAEADPRSAGARLRKALVDAVRPKSFHAIRGDTVPVEAEVNRYGDLYRRLDPAVVVAGVGGSGRLGLVEPPGDFTTTAAMAAVALSDVTRREVRQSRLFLDLDEVPRYGLTLTVPALTAPRTVLVLDDEPGHAGMLKAALEGPVSIMCPASVLQTRPGARLFLTRAAAAQLDIWQ